MGHCEHDAVIVTTGSHRAGGLPDVDAFRETLPPKWRALVVGPVRSVVDGYVTYAFLPDGFGSGWGDDEAGDWFRAGFVAMFQQRYEDGSSADDVVLLTYGADHRRCELAEVPPVAVYGNDISDIDEEVPGE